MLSWLKVLTLQLALIETLLVLSTIIKVIMEDHQVSIYNIMEHTTFLIMELE